MKNKNSLKAFVLLTIAGAVVSAGTRIWAVLLCLDASYGVYDHGSILPTVTHILTLVICAALAVFGLIEAKKYPCPIAPEADTPVVFTSCVTAFLMAADTILSLYNVLIAGVSLDRLTLLKMVFSVPAIIFLLSLLKTSIKSAPAMAVMSLFPTAWFATELICVYFDTSLLITSPAKTFHQLALLSIMLFLLCESRFILSRSDGRLFFVLSGIAPVIILTSSLPSLILPGSLLIGDSDSYLVYAIECAAALFILSRAWSFAKSPETLPKPECEEQPSVPESTEEN